MRRKTIDYDALFKGFLGDFFPDFVAFVNPVLFAAIDWPQGYVFLEQEFINALRGKFKLRGKRRYTDKLVRVQLLICFFSSLIVSSWNKLNLIPNLPQYLRFALVKTSQK